MNPFVWGELGLMSYSFKSESTPASDAKDTGGVLAGGAGVGVPLGGVNAWVAAGYTQNLGLTNATTCFGLYADVSFALGGG